MLVVIEGVDGAGKTALCSRVSWLLWSRLPGKAGGHFSVAVDREPTRGPIGEMVRASLGRNVERETMALLFAADRVEHKVRINAILREQDMVICDRYYHSTIAYQGCDLDWTMAINEHAMRPDLALFIDVPVDVAIGRIEARRAEDARRFSKAAPEWEPDRQAMVAIRGRYQAMAAVGMLEAIDGTPSLEDVAEVVYQRIVRLIEDRSIVVEPVRIDREVEDDMAVEFDPSASQRMREWVALWAGPFPSEKPLNDGSDSPTVSDNPE